MIASTSTGAVLDEDPDIGAEAESDVVLDAAVWAWPVIFDQIVPRILMEFPLTEGEEAKRIALYWQEWLRTNFFTHGAGVAGSSPAPAILEVLFGKRLI